MTTPNTTPREPITTAQLTIAGASKASWADLQAIFGTADYPGKCYCQRFKTRDCHWSSLSDRERRSRLREQTQCDNPRAPTTTGLVAYLDKEPVGWVAVEPRTAYPRLLRTRTVPVQHRAARHVQSGAQRDSSVADIRQDATRLPHRHASPAAPPIYAVDRD